MRKVHIRPSEHSSHSFIVYFWGIYAISFVLCTQLSLRVEVYNFLVPPSVYFLIFIVLFILPFPRLFNYHDTRIVAVGAAAYILAMFVSVLVSTTIMDYTFTYMSYKVIFKWIQFFLIIILVVGTLKRTEDIIFLVKAAVFSMILVCIYGLLLSIFVRGIEHPMNPFFGIGNRNMLSNWTAGVFILNFYLIYIAKTLGRVFWSIGLSIMIFVQLLSYSRSGGLLISLSILAFTFTLLKRKRLKAAIFTIFAILVVIAIAGHFLLSFQIKKLTGRFNTLSTLEAIDDSSMSRRMYVVKTMELFHTYPILGVGAGNFTQYEYKGFHPRYSRDASHNVYLDIIGETGIIGASILAFLSFKIFKLIREARRKAVIRQDEQLLTFLWLSVLMYMLRGITSNEVLFMPITGFIFGLALSCTTILIKEQALQKRTRTLLVRAKSVV